MKVEKLAVGTLFDSTQRLDAPLFQRPYVWRKKKNWVPLWDVVSKLAERRLHERSDKPHFLGTVVLVQQSVPTGRVHTREIIDGQQRLITLQVLLAAIRDLCSYRGQPQYFGEFSKLTRNHTPLSQNAEDAFKVWPTNTDREEFRAVMASHEAAEDLSEDDEDDDEVEEESDEDGGGLITQAHAYLTRKAGDWLYASDSATMQIRLDALHLAITRDLTLVVIDLERDDDPQEIFETLNGLGTPLLPADLVKNHLFHLAAMQGRDVDALHRQYWSGFDDNRKYWRKEIGRGRQKRPRLDVFLTHFLTLRTAGEGVTVERLFESFREFVDGSRTTPVEEHLREFSNYASVYRRFEEFDPASAPGKFFHRLSFLEITTAHPLLLEVVRRYANPAGESELVAILNDLESFFVRRAVCGLPTRSYNEFFRALIKQCREKDDFAHAQIRSALLSGSSEVARWPANDEFHENWKEREFYRKLKRATPMILQSIEDALRSPKSEIARIDGSVVTIEHLMPQRWESHWPPPISRGEGPEQMARERKRAIHRVGNLTLLTKSLNPSISNGPWDEKRAAIKSHGTLLLHNSFLDQARWDEAAIDRRSEYLFQLATGIWRRP